MPNKDKQPEVGCAQGQGVFTQVDVQRAISAARDAGLRDYRVEIAPDGTIAIVVGAAARAADGTTVFDSSAD
ncbi:hypothetical protein [Alteraurantiacibacter aestuarii]|uniref:Uncharacterized protein n=2 Tax=Alteraurantiacibacter aestuarii TaxID=650004 RepID=A0A844ZMP7_9SPHN|nr:hypothetical protein [Alteraurantiacibacter aestuarii]